MAYSESLAERIRTILGHRQDIEKKKLFGCICFFLNGNVLVGVWNTSLIVRLGPEQAGVALKEPHVKEFDITGRAMTGWAMVEAEGVDEDHQLTAWIERAEEFVETLPAK